MTHNRIGKLNLAGRILTGMICILFFLSFPLSVSADTDIRVKIPVAMEDQGGTAVLKDAEGNTVSYYTLGEKGKSEFELFLPYGDYTYTVRMQGTDAKHMDGSVYQVHVMTYISDSGADTYALVLNRDDDRDKSDACSFRNYNDPKKQTVVPAKKVKKGKTQRTSNAKTNDTSGIWFWSVLTCISAGGILIITLVTVKKNEKEERTDA